MKDLNRIQGVSRVCGDPPHRVKRIETGGGGSGTKDHNALINRDMKDQHPIDAISRLTQELSARPTDSMTNTDIQRILNM